MEEYSPGWRALFFLAPSMKNPPKVTSRVVSRSPRFTAVTQTQYNKNTMETNPFYVLRHKNIT